MSVYAQWVATGDDDGIPEELREEWDRIFRRTWLDRLFWDRVLPYATHFTVVVIAFFWMWAAWDLMHGAWVLALYWFGLGFFNVCMLWVRYRRAQEHRHQMMLLHAMTEIERPDPS